MTLCSNSNVIDIRITANVKLNSCYFKAIFLQALYKYFDPRVQKLAHNRTLSSFSSEILLLISDNFPIFCYFRQVKLEKPAVHQSVSSRIQEYIHTYIEFIPQIPPPSFHCWSTSDARALLWPGNTLYYL